MLLLTIATVVLAGGSFWAAVHYGRKALTEARNANTLATERSVVRWYVGRQDQDNPGWFYVANIGEDTAHEVAVTARYGLEHVTAKADHLRPYRNDTGPTAHPSDYIEFRLPKREQEGPMPVKGPNRLLLVEDLLYARSEPLTALTARRSGSHRRGGNRPRHRRRDDPRVRHAKLGPVEDFGNPVSRGEVKRLLRSGGVQLASRSRNQGDPNLGPMR